MTRGTLALVVYFTLCIVVAIGYLWKALPPVLRQEVDFETSSSQQAGSEVGKLNPGEPSSTPSTSGAPISITPSQSTISSGATSVTISPSTVTTRPRPNSSTEPNASRGSISSRTTDKSHQKGKEGTATPGKEGDAARYLIAHFVTVLIALGFLGGAVSGITSLATYIGNGDLHDNWFSWYWVRPWTGSAVGLVAVLSLDFLNFDPRSRAAICFLSFLAGFLTRQFIDKLVDIGESIFQSKQNEKRANKLQEKDGGPSLVVGGATPVARAGVADVTTPNPPAGGTTGDRTVQGLENL